MGRPSGIQYQRTVSMRLEDELGEALERMAKEEERSIGTMARILVREAIEAQSKEIRKLTGNENRKTRQIKVAKEES